MTREPRHNAAMASETPLERTEHGLVPTGDGWFVLNARDARWSDRPERGLRCVFEGEAGFPQFGVSIYVLSPGQPMSMYHWEDGQEDFLVLDGEAVLIVENEERPLRAWDFVHCPAGVPHTILGAGGGSCVVLAVGVREHYSRPDAWGGYTIDEAAVRHGATVERETLDPEEAYARFPESEPARYRDGSLPG